MLRKKAQLSRLRPLLFVKYEAELNDVTRLGLGIGWITHINVIPCLGGLDGLLPS